MRRVRKFLRLFVTDWLAAMTGGLSLLFVVLSLYLSADQLRLAFALLAALGIALAAFRVWAKTDEKLESEIAKNALPELQGTILDIQSVPAGKWGFSDTDGGLPLLIDYVLVATVRVVNTRNVPTTVSTVRAVFRAVSGQIFSDVLNQQCAGEISLSEIPRPGEPVHLKLDTRLDDLSITLKKEPLIRGVEREGWLRFYVKAVPFAGSGPSLLEQATATVILTDAFGQEWPVSGKPPWKPPGQIHLSTRKNWP